MTQTDTTCVIEWKWTGTHTGDMENWPAKGEAINLIGANVISLDGDLIAEGTSYWDKTAMFGG